MARPLSDGDRVRLSDTAKMLWIPYQLSVFDEIAHGPWFALTVCGLEQVAVGKRDITGSNPRSRTRTAILSTA